MAFSDIIVVAIVLVNSEGKMFLAQRPIDKGGSWEFPGGKKEVHENLSQALLRETREELGIDIDIDQDLGMQKVKYNNKSYLIHFFLSHYKNQKIQLLEHINSGWFTLSELKNIEISPGNLEFIKNNDKIKLFIR